jgi:hypothetical protein
MVLRGASFTLNNFSSSLKTIQFKIYSIVLFFTNIILNESNKLHTTKTKRKLFTNFLSY